MRSCLSFLFFLLSTAIVFTACTRDDETLQNTEKEILSFKVLKADSTEFPLDDVVATVKGDSILIFVPYGSNRNPLIPVFTFKGFSVSPGSGVAQDFSKPVRYTVMAEDGSSRVYTVVVSWNAGPLVYFGADFDFYCVAGAIGRQIWKFTGEGYFASSSPTYAHGTIYVGNSDGHLYALHPATGALKWKKKISNTGIESAAVCVNGTIYIGTNDDEVHALDTAGGRTKWVFQTGDNVMSSPVVAEGVVYVGSADSKLYALDAVTGQQKWSFTTGAMIGGSGAALVNGILYVGSRDGKLYAIRASDGTQVWAFDTGGISLEQSSPTVANGIVYMAGWYELPNGRPGSLYAIDAATGQLRWESLNGVGISSSPYVYEGVVYVSADDRSIHAFNAATGASIWSREILPNGAEPVVYGGMVYVSGSGTRNFYALDVATGNPIWTFPLPQGQNVSNPLLLRTNNAPIHSSDSGARQ